MTMRIAAKRGRFPAAKKKRLKSLVKEIREQKQRDKEMAEARLTSGYYRMAQQILWLCDGWYHGEIDCDTAMSIIHQALHFDVCRLKGLALGDDYYDVDAHPKKQAQMDYDNVLVFRRHDLRTNDTLTANMIYMIDNTVGMWYDGYYSDKLAMNLLEDFATVLASAWSGRKHPLPYRPGR